MTTEQLQKAIHAAPFQPFVIRVADGRQFRVPHPDFVAHKPGGRTAAVSLDDETIEVIDLLRVTGLVVEQPVSSEGA